jgi:hypothetical protein
MRQLSAPALTDMESPTLSARVVVVTPLHPYWGETCYIVRSRKKPDCFLCEVIGQPKCRAWFAEYDLMDERNYNDLADRQ